jgi:hypothetical protein
MFSGSEEGRDHPGWRRGVHHDREEDPCPRRQPSLPHQSSLLLSGSRIVFFFLIEVKPIRSVSDPYPGGGSGFNQVSGSVSGSSRAKMAHKIEKKLRNLIFWSAGCSLWRAEGLEVLYGGLGIGKLEFLIKWIRIRNTAHPNPLIHLMQTESVPWILGSGYSPNSDPSPFRSVDTYGFEVFLVGMSVMVPHFSFALLVLIFWEILNSNKSCWRISLATNWATISMYVPLGKMLGSTKNHNSDISPL